MKVMKLVQHLLKSFQQRSYSILNTYFIRKQVPWKSVLDVVQTFHKWFLIKLQEQLPYIRYALLESYQTDSKFQVTQIRSSNQMKIFICQNTKRWWLRTYNWLICLPNFLTIWHFWLKVLKNYNIFA